MKKNFSIKEALFFGWQTTRRNSSLFFGVAAAMLFWVLFFNYLQEAVAGGALSFSILVVMLIGNMILMMGLIRICLDFCAGEKPKFSRLFSMYPLAHFYFAASLLFFLMAWAGFLLFIIPGLILGLIFWFYDFALIDKRLRPIAALKESIGLTRGIRVKLFLFLFILFFIFIGFFLAWALLTFPLGFVFAVMPEFVALMVYGLVVGLPLMLVVIICQLAQTHVYVNLRDNASQSASLPSQQSALLSQS